MEGNGSEFTWEKSRGTSSWMQIRLDRGLVTTEWQAMFPRAEIRVLEDSWTEAKEWSIMEKMAYRFRSRRDGYGVKKYDEARGTTETLSEREVVKKISDEQDKELVMPVTREEVKNAAFSMHPDKSPGIDGELPQAANKIVVCLIPKIKNPQKVTDLRPISLCNVLIRIVSKVLANRLKECLPVLISDSQSAFIENRLLTDNALLAFELNYYIRRKRQGKNGVVGFKIDVSKAYDRLEWHFLEAMMQKFGFNSVWIDRVMKCVITVSYSFVQDGEIFGDVQPQRGIRQGDPMSPYLYILCAEGLSSMIRRHEQVGLLHGCSIARGAPPVSHLLFADDSYFFFRATKSEALTMKNILLKYERLSGQAINFGKSNVVFSPNTTSRRRREVCETLQVAEVSVPGKYLGFPMHIGRRKNKEFKFLVERISSNLEGWSNKSISRGGDNDGCLTNEMPQELEHIRVVNLMETGSKRWDEEDEDATHVLFDCSYARSVWTQIQMGLTDVSTAGYEGHITDIIQHFAEKCSREFGVQALVMNMLHEWKQKCAEGKRQGIGNVIRDEHGQFIRARNHKLQALYSPREDEALGLKEALSWVKELGYKRCVFETDAKELVEACRSARGNTYFHLIVLDCIDLLKHYDEVLVDYVPRSANVVAHELARAIYSMSGVHEWVDTPPDCIRDVLIIDSIE
ncbi:hypothetical protein AgCh_011101 [Apium graveolens]